MSLRQCIKGHIISLVIRPGHQKLRGQQARNAQTLGAWKHGRHGHLSVEWGCVVPHGTTQGSIFRENG